MEEVLIIVHQIHGLNGPHFVLFLKDEGQTGGAGLLAEVFRLGRRIHGVAGVQGQRPRSLFGNVAGGLVRPVPEQVDVGFQHPLLLGP